MLDTMACFPIAMQDREYLVDKGISQSPFEIMDF
jgi:hypothetical protein